MIEHPVELTIAGGVIRSKVNLPDGPVRPEDVLDVFRSATDMVVHISERALNNAGKKISCRAGCGACCRQYVPISAMEARRLIEYVGRFPEPRKTEVLARFARAAEAIRAAGLADLLARASEASLPEVEHATAAYFRLGIPCPFLENESCSIYEERPLICREYLVSTPPELCAQLSPQIDSVRLAAIPSRALADMERKPWQARAEKFPLSMLFDLAQELPPPPAPEDAAAIVDHFFSACSKQCRA